MKKLFVRLLKDQSGVTAMEYGLIAGLVAVVIIGAVTTVGTELNAVFTTIATDLAAIAGGLSQSLSDVVGSRARRRRRYRGVALSSLFAFGFFEQNERSRILKSSTLTDTQGA